jgi:ClpP class serine protease
VKTFPALRFLESNQWALHSPIFDALCGIIERHAEGVKLTPDEIAAAIGRPVALQNEPADEAPKRLEPMPARVQSTAIVSMRGVLAQYADQVNNISQPQGRSAESVQSDLRAALNDPSVDRVVLRIDSPGGMVAGTSETADMVRTLQEAGKPVFAYVDGQCMSAAYWIAATCDVVTASAANAMVGSIGVMSGVVEDVQRADRPKITRIRSSPLKAPGGDTVSPEQLASVQRMVNAMAGEFYAHVAEARGLDAKSENFAAAITGEAFTAGQGKALGLVDNIQSWDAFIASVLGVSGNSLASGALPGAQPAAFPAASSPETPAGTDTMRITAAVLLAIAASAAAEDAELISSMATGDPAKGTPPASEDEIRSALMKREHPRLKARIATLEGEMAAAKTAHATALDALRVELTAEKSKASKLGALGAGAGQDPGADANAAGVVDDAQSEAGLKASWGKLTAAQRMGFCDDFAGFVAWSKNSHRDKAMAAAEAAEKAKG